MPKRKPKLKFAQLIKGVLTKPTKTMAQIAKTKPLPLLWAFGIIFLSIILFFIGDLAIMDVKSMVQDWAMLLGWVISAAIISFIARALGGKGNFVKTLCVTGWATVPSLIGGLIYIPATILSVSESLSLITAALALIIISFIFDLWGLVLTIIGVREAHKISTGRAVIAVLLIPAIFLVIFGILAFYTGYTPF